MRTVRFMKWNCEVIEERYIETNRIALKLVDKLTGELISTATVNILAPLAPGEIIIKDYSKNIGMHKALLKSGIVGPVKRWIGTGHVECPVCDYLQYKK